MESDSELLQKQLEVNNERIRKLEEHKKSVESQLKNPPSGKDREFLLETIRRLEYNLQIEYKQHEGILNAINSENCF